MWTCLLQLLLLCMSTKQVVPSLQALEKLFAHVNTNLPYRAYPPIQHGTVEVFVEPLLIKVSDVDETADKISFQLIIPVLYTMPNLTWNPKAYENMTYITAKYAEIPVWIPPIIVLNLLRHETLNDETVTIGHNGKVSIHKTIEYTTVCHFEMHYFPWDIQVCKIHFSLDGYFDIIKFPKCEDFEHTFYQEHNSWQLLGTSCVKLPMPEHVFHGKLVIEENLVYHIIVKRKPGFFIYTIFVPIVCLAHVGIVIFIVPANSGVKMNICLSLILSFYIFLSSINETLPRTTQEHPIIALYILITFVGLCFSTLGASLLQYLAQIDEKSARVAQQLNGTCILGYFCVQLGTCAWLALSYYQMEDAQLVASNETSGDGIISYRKRHYKMFRAVELGDDDH